MKTSVEKLTDIQNRKNILKKLVLDKQKQFADNLRQIIFNEQLKLSDVAKDADIDISVLARLLDADYPLDIDIITRVAGACDYELDIIYHKGESK